jgi:hypothetical protein
MEVTVGAGSGNQEVTGSALQEDNVHHEEDGTQQEDCATELMSASVDKNDIDSWTIVDGAEAIETQITSSQKVPVK